MGVENGVRESCSSLKTPYSQTKSPPHAPHLERMSLRWGSLGSSRWDFRRSYLGRLGRPGSNGTKEKLVITYLFLDGWMAGVRNGFWRSPRVYPLPSMNRSKTMQIGSPSSFSSPPLPLGKDKGTYITGSRAKGH